MLDSRHYRNLYFFALLHIRKSNIKKRPMSYLPDVNRYCSQTEYISDGSINKTLKKPIWSIYYFKIMSACRTAYYVLMILFKRKVVFQPGWPGLPVKTWVRTPHPTPNGNALLYGQFTFWNTHQRNFHISIIQNDGNHV